MLKQLEFSTQSPVWVKISLRAVGVLELRSSGWADQSMAQVHRAAAPTSDRPPPVPVRLEIDELSRSMQLSWQALFPD